MTEKISFKNVPGSNVNSSLHSWDQRPNSFACMFSGLLNPIANLTHVVHRISVNLVIIVLVPPSCWWSATIPSQFLLPVHRKCQQELRNTGTFSSCKSRSQEEAYLSLMLQALPMERTHCQSLITPWLHMVSTSRCCSGKTSPSAVEVPCSTFTTPVLAVNPYCQHWPVQDWALNL